MRKWLIRAAFLLATALLFFWLKTSVLKPKPLPVTVVEASVGLVEETITNSRAGTVKARRRAKLSPEIGGRVVELPFREGDRVKAGAIVLRLEDDVYRARLRLAERDLDVAKAEEERACLTAQRSSREVERSRRLSADGIVSKDLLDQLDSQAMTTAAACRAAGASVGRAQAALAVSRTEGDKTLLRAPFDAIVAEVSIEIGEWTTPSPPAVPVPPVVDLIDPSSIYISAPMDEVDSARIHSGQRARITVDSHREQSFDGSVDRIAPYVLDLEEQNRTVEIDAVLDDPTLAEALLPGTSADVEVILEIRENVLRLPTSALIEGNRVLVVVGDHLIERELEVGLRNWDYAEIRGGLEQGDRVVTSLDRAEVREGALVQIEESEGAGSGVAP